jgi:uncharacterized membrane protein
MNHRSERPGVPGPLTGLVAGGVTVVVLAVALGLGALGVTWAWVAYPLGFGAVLPLALGVAGWYERRARTDDRHPTDDRRTSEDAALAELRRRYARSEIDEATFERRVERLLETETVDDAREQLHAGEPGR